jgi:hypothetical protein
MLTCMRTFLVIVHHGIDPTAHGIAAHQPGIVGLEEVGRRSQIPRQREFEQTKVCGSLPFGKTQFGNFAAVQQQGKATFPR